MQSSMLYGPSIQEDSHLPKLSQRKRKPPTDNMKAYEDEAIKLKLQSVLLNFYLSLKNLFNYKLFI